ncbi:MAG: hypothetical protein K6U14_08175 [Firmicutes bacterium]|nr:hypothetical protein [Alicyclobacillaceae bacterium]MCL6497590.1 hypothetical protein [Bacillota bacterium]
MPHWDALTSRCPVRAPSLAQLTGTPFAAVNAPAITTNALPEETVGQPYSATLSATGG